MQLGIIGLPSAGKTTIFNALTGADLPTGPLSAGTRMEVHTAIVDVPDVRADALNAFYKPRKLTYARVTYADIGGMQAKSGAEGLSGQLLNQLSHMDGFLHVVRAFEDENIPHPDGSVDPRRDFEAMESELLLNDMVVVERRLHKLGEDRGKGGRDREQIDREIALFTRISDILGEEKPLRTMVFTADEENTLSGFGLLTRKPVLVVVNTAEGVQDAAEVMGDALGEGVHAVSLQGLIEMEISQLSADEAQDFLDEYGIEKPGSESVIQASYDLLGFHSFFTVGEDEVRAWRIPVLGNALEVAGIIHTDLARGFIRAEVIAWQELIDLNGLVEARKLGKLRVEGKSYPVKDGEVVHIRFNI